MALLEIDDLSVTFDSEDGPVHAVNGLSLSVDRGETLGLVGESGSGKSQTAFALMGLLARNGRAKGSVRFDGHEVLGLPPREMNRLRADRMAIVFQDPMTSLNPYMRISHQMVEVLRLHRGMGRREAEREAVRMLDAVRIPGAKERIRLYPHEFSGGMRQRVMIAMALLCQPDLLIADEPTTALDVTVQAQIMDLLSELQRELGMATILITHDLGVVAGFCERVTVLYGGRVMEEGPVDPIFARPTHPYTRGLLAAVPRVDDAGGRMRAIPGNPPDMADPPEGCPFGPRCALAGPDCRTMPPLAPFEGARARACHRPIEEVRA